MGVWSSYIHTHGTSYALASLFFSSRLKHAVHTLYAFVRIPDDIVDSHTLSRQQKTSRLHDFRDSFTKKYHNATYTVTASDYYDHNIITDAVQLRHTYNIPFAYADAFLSAMESDIHTHRYDTYNQLQQYMYGSAIVVGYMMCYLLGTYDAITLKYAALLGEAMQYTNFLRDIHEDYTLYDRIYMPTSILTQYDMTHDTIINACTTPHRTPPSQRRVWMKDQCEHAHNLYIAAAPGIKHLPGRSRTAVRIASALYSGILIQIRLHKYNPIAYKCHTSSFHKIRIATRTLLRPCHHNT